MELVNTTCASVIVDLTVADELPGEKVAECVGKLTFAITERGGLELISDDPEPVRRVDAETACGLLPRDTGLPDFDGIEVLVNGAAYAPHGVPVGEMEVSLQIGDRVHRALVFGDRAWIRSAAQSQPTPPVSFVRMPLTYDRAYGGTTEVWLDANTAVPLSDPRNPSGLGFDPRPLAEGLAEELDCPSGYPRFDAERRLCNIEDPDQRVLAWESAPPPHCWSARPAGFAVAAEIESMQGGSAERVPAQSDAAMLRGHPTLLLERLPEGLPIEIIGMTSHDPLRFYFPRVGLEFDYTIDGRQGSVAMRARRVVLLPEERRFYVTFESRFRFAAQVGGDRSLRVRIAAS